ncbi:MAG: response regulator transcription factor [Candidatus Promineifilaceae bacterium]|nr:response regulator transcription factor [Candidatus Promineifilaceae bacterium]
MSTITVLLAEDHMLVRKGIRRLLDDHPQLTVVAEAADGRAAVDAAARHRPDVALIDVTMPLLNGIEAARRIKQQRPQTKVLMLTMHENDQYLLQSIKAGATGYMLKEAAPNQLVEAIFAAHNDDPMPKSVFSRKLLDIYERQEPPEAGYKSYERLTNREREVLQLLAEGHTIQGIAELLGISDKTVRTHRANMMNKLELFGEAEVTLYALRQGIISLGD